MSRLLISLENNFCCVVEGCVIANDMLALYTALRIKIKDFIFH